VSVRRFDKRDHRGGETYPVYKMEISNTSHPFYTGKMKLVDTAGRVDKFMSRYAKRYDKKNAAK